MSKSRLAAYSLHYIRFDNRPVNPNPHSHMTGCGWFFFFYIWPLTRSYSSSPSEEESKNRVMDSDTSNAPISTLAGWGDNTPINQIVMNTGGGGGGGPPYSRLQATLELSDSQPLTLTGRKHLYSLTSSGFCITLPIHKFNFFSNLILCEFLQRLGTTQPVTVHCLADTSLKIVPTNPRVPSEKYTLPGLG